MLSLIAYVALPWHAYKCLSCQLFFSLLYAALMFHADEAHTCRNTQTHTHLYASTRSFIVHSFWQIFRQKIFHYFPPV